MFNKLISNHFKKPHGLIGKMVNNFQNKQNKAIYLKTIKYLDIKDEDKILDIGCGNGYTLRLIANEYPHTILMGIDYSSSIIKEAIKSTTKANLNNISYEISDVLAFNKNNYFDKIYCINTIYFWQDLDEYIKKISTLLKKQGILYVTYMNKSTLDQYSFTKYNYLHRDLNEIDLVLRNNGFSVNIKKLFKTKGFVLIATKK
ncbi:MAG: class I SAM-dependent methyltransferase [Bacilli bacterium]|jgi:cyclopropane fatty-acyl-phospholipid synthase-like methyltransferase|nr:class I SAM-dependent methyltransferase [Bacilli bacterium]